MYIVIFISVLQLFMKFVCTGARKKQIAFRRQRMDIDVFVPPGATNATSKQSNLKSSSSDSLTTHNPVCLHFRIGISTVL